MRSKPTASAPVDLTQPNMRLLNLIALVLVIGFAILADWRNREAAHYEMRQAANEQIGLLRAKLEGNINGNIHLVQGLIATIRTEPDMSQERFATLATDLFTGTNQLRHVASAPNMVIAHLYPTQGNEAAFGLDLTATTGWQVTQERVVEGGEIVVAGPVDLVQGGSAFIARLPVYLSQDRDALAWGIMSAVIDIDRLYADSGLLDPDLPLELALVGRNASGAAGEQFFGRPEVMVADPVTADIVLPSGSWQLAAVPRNGWQLDTATVWLQRLVISIAGTLVMLPLIITGRLTQQRRRNLSELQVREAKLQRLSRRLELALDASRVGVWEYTIETDTLVWDERMRQLYGIPPQTRRVVVDDWSKTLHPDDRQRAEQDFQTALHTGGTYRSDFRIVLPDGETRHIRAKADVHTDPDGTNRIVGLNWDITADVTLHEALESTTSAMEQRNVELEQAKARIEHMALHDSLTGLANRRFVDAELSKTPATGVNGAPPRALLIVDLDRFKQINDTLGHTAGDALLIHVAEMLQGLARPNDVVARIGGDEFVIVCRSNTTRQDLMLLAHSVVMSAREPMVYQGKQCAFGVSVGIAAADDEHEPGADLLIKADVALYETKNSGRNGFAFYTPDLQTRTLLSKEAADQISLGLERGEFIPHYQPQYDARSRRVVGVEALARWHHPERGVLAPAEFMDTAREYDLASRIDHEILTRTLSDLAIWRGNGIDVPRVSVNVSAQRLHDNDLFGRLEELVFEPGTLSFELLESIFLDDSDSVELDRIRRIKALGIDIEIDDFGTGHTSIISLLKVNPKRLKIDRQMVFPMLESQASRNLVRSVVEIGKSLNIEVVAEGVETERHARLLARMGCDVLQGYALGKPMTADLLVEHIGGPVACTA